MQLEEEEEKEEDTEVLIQSTGRVGLIQCDVNDRHEISNANSLFKYWFVLNAEHWVRRTLHAVAIVWPLNTHLVNETERPL